MNTQTGENHDAVNVAANASQAESIESKASQRGGKRPGAGRKPNLAKMLLKGFSREAITEGAARVDVGAIIARLLRSKREKTVLETLAFVRDTTMGRPAQNVSLSGGVLHAHTVWRPLSALNDEEIALLDKLTKKLSAPASDTSPDAPQNQTGIKHAIEMKEGMQGRTPSGEAASGSDGLFEAVSTYHEASPGGLSGKRDDKKHVVAIDKGLQPVADFNG
jgi:hypothetical protein